MASVIKEIVIDAAPEDVWDVVSDFAGGPMRAHPGPLAACRVDEPGVRTLVFADGSEARERLVARDDEARRVVWAWIDDHVVHDNASMQVFADGEDQSRLVWIHDVLPDHLGAQLDQAMDQLAPLIQRTLGR